MVTPAEVIARLRELHGKATPGAWEPRGIELPDDRLGFGVTSPEASPRGKVRFVALTYMEGIDKSVAPTSLDDSVVDAMVITAEHNAFAALLDVALNAHAVSQGLREAIRRGDPSGYPATASVLLVFARALESPLKRLAEVGP